MIDFRYHLISIIAVFLALGIGILMGSLVLGENLVDQLERELGAIKKRNNELQTSIEDLNRQLEIDERFAQIAYQHLVGSQLEGERIVLFTFESTDGELLDGIRSSIEDAGGTVGGVVTATGKLRLESQPARDELALVLSSTEGDAEALRSELGQTLGSDAASQATGQQQDGDSQAANQLGDRGTPGSLEDLLRELEETDFVKVDLMDGDRLVDGSADFIIVGGGTNDPPFPLNDYALGLGKSLGLDAVPVLAAESSDSTWGLVGAVRNDQEANSVLTTVDQAESVSGRVAVVLGLEGSEEGVVGHYGIGPDAQSIIPESEQP
jgi:hypothetical protein